VSDNNLENIFLTNARAFKQIKNENGSTLRTETREIPGATFCIPYKNVANMNLVYVYKDKSGLEADKLITYTVNIGFFLSITFVIVSIWFDLTDYGISGFWDKLWYFICAFIALANLKLLFLFRKREWVSQFAVAVSAVSWILTIMDLLDIWIALGIFLGALVIASLFTVPLKRLN
jgi:uncharacterized membrane protein YjjB (DUF3815 family)